MITEGIHQDLVLISDVNFRVVGFVSGVRASRSLVGVLEVRSMMISKESKAILAL